MIVLSVYWYIPLLPIIVTSLTTIAMKYTTYRSQLIIDIIIWFKLSEENLISVEPLLKLV